MSENLNLSSLDLQKIAASFFTLLQNQAIMGDQSSLTVSSPNPNTTIMISSDFPSAATLMVDSASPRRPLKRVASKTEPNEPPVKKQKSKGRVSVSKAKSKIPTLPTRRFPIRQYVRKATQLKKGTRAAFDTEAIDLSNTKIEEITPPAFLTCYAANRRLI